MPLLRIILLKCSVEVFMKEGKLTFERLWLQTGKRGGDFATGGLELLLFPSSHFRAFEALLDLCGVQPPYLYPLRITLDVLVDPEHV